MIYVIPWGDINIASSRLRVYNIQPFLDSIIGIPEKYSSNDILIIQKTPQIEELRKAKRQGAKVVYDIDDYYWKRPEFKVMIDEADIVTVDSEYKAKLLKAVCIPDSLDWNGTEANPEKNIIGWTGYGNNSVYLNDITLPNKYTLRLITSPDWMQHYKGKAQSRPWSLEMVDKYLAECEFTIYPLPEGEFEQSKGMHKLLKSWAIGIPCYTSPMPDYVKAMKEAGVNYIVKDWSKLKNIGFDPKCKEYAMKYKPEIIAKQWKKILNSI